MKKIKKVFVYALIIALVINLAGFLVNVILNNLDEAIKDIIYLAPISFSLFFVPTFFSALCYEKKIFKDLKNTVKLILKPALWSFLIIYLFVFLYINIQKDFSIPFFNKVSFPNAVFASIISLFSMLILFLSKKSNKKYSKSMKLNPIYIGLIWLTITISYLLLHVIFGHGLSRGNYRILILPAFGLFVALSSLIFIRINQKMKKPYILFSSLYLFNCIGVLIIYMFSVIDITKLPNEKLISLFFQGIVIFTPYFLLITLAIHVYYINLKNKQEKQNLKQIGVYASLKYQQLKSQISPHFLFNNISVLTGLIEEDQEKAVKFSEDLSKIYRYFLEQEKQDLVTLKDELFFAEKYIALLKVRFEDTLIFNNDVNKGDETLYILPMALQQVFENVVKHNELTIENPITISMAHDNDYLIVSNTLHTKLTVDTTDPTGLENIKKRYAYFTDEKVIISKDNNLFTIKIPLLKSEVK